VVTTIVVLAVAIGVIVRRGRGGRTRAHGGPPRGAGLLLAAAVHLFPPDRREWGRAMVVELDEVPGPLARWRFALGGAWAGIVASGRAPVPVAGVAVVVGVAAGVGAATYAVSSATHVFGIALAIVLVLAGVSWPRRRRITEVTTGVAVLRVTLLAGAAACVALTLYGVSAYPAAAVDDDTTAYSLVLAATLGAYVWVGLGGWPAADRDDGASPAPVGAGLGPVLVGLLVGGGYAIAGVATDRVGAVVFVVGAGVAGLALAGGFGAHLIRRGTTERDVVAAGLRTGLVAGVAYFVVALSATYLTASWTVRDQEVLAGFRASGLSDLATYLVSEALAVAVGALVGLPVLILGATWAGATFIASRPRPTPEPQPHPPADVVP
jgi:hypothetical protein